MIADDLLYFCICDEEWCWCTNRVLHDPEPCAECAAGNHKMEPPK